MKKIITLALIAAMMLTMIVANVSAAWDGTTATAFTGTGTTDDPYVIASAENLKYLQEQVAAGTNYGGKFFVQTADIDLGGKAWTPIGTKDLAFRGIYNGKGHKVTGLYYTVASIFGGLFGAVKSTGSESSAILNLTVEGKVDTWTDTTADNANIGGLIGYSEGTATTPVVVANCVVDVDINVAVPETLADGKIMYIAGVSGYANNFTAVNTVNNGDVTATSKGRHLFVGGFIGNGYNAITLENVVNNGNISATVNSAQLSVVSGMVARSNGGTTVKNSVNNGNISSVGNANAFVSGVIAQIFNINTTLGVNIESTANAGNLYAESKGESTFGYAGGMVGYENKGYTTVKNCVNKGTVTIESIQSNKNPGGIIGVSNFADKNSRFENCVSTGRLVGWTNATAEIVLNCTDEADVAVVDAAIRTIEDAQKATSSVTVNGAKYDFVSAAPVVPTPPTPSTPSNPSTGDVTSVIILALVAVSCGAVITLKKTR